MNIATMIITVLGLSLFEIVSSIDNAVINAEVLGTMSARGKRWFLGWGFILAVFIVRGLLPWIIVWAATPMLSPLQALTATWNANTAVSSAIERTAPILLMGGGVFLVLLFFHWLFLEKKAVGLPHERFFQNFGAQNNIRFFATIVVFLSILIGYCASIALALVFACIIGAIIFFITDGFKENAEKAEKELTFGKHPKSDLSKILYLEIIDATFSVDGVLGAFAFTLSVPLILIGNGLGAFILRKLTLGNIEQIKKYIYLKNGAMHSIAVLGLLMIADGFGAHIPAVVSPLITFVIIGYFFLKSHNTLKS
jgi:hypothetical protein